MTFVTFKVAQESSCHYFQVNWGFIEQLIFLSKQNMFSVCSLNCKFSLYILCFYWLWARAYIFFAKIIVEFSRTTKKKKCHVILCFFVLFPFLHQQQRTDLVMPSRVSWENWVTWKAHNMNSQTSFPHLYPRGCVQPNEFIMKNQYWTLSYEFSIFNPNSFILLFVYTRTFSFRNKKRVLHWFPP